MAEEERRSGGAQLEKEVAWDPPWTEVLMGKSPFPSTSEQPSYSLALTTHADAHYSLTLTTIAGVVAAQDTTAELQGEGAV